MIPIAIYWTNIWVNRHHSYKCVGQVILAPQNNSPAALGALLLKKKVSLAGLLLPRRFKKAAMLEGESFDFYREETSIKKSIERWDERKRSLEESMLRDEG